MSWIFWLISFSGWGQSHSTAYAAEITAENLKRDLTIYASDTFEGRETGTRGQKLASEFIANAFEKAGLTPLVNGSYFMPVPLFQKQPQPKETFIKVGKFSHTNFDDLVYLGEDDCLLDDNVLVYAGLGRSEDLDNLEVKGKAVLVYLPTEPSNLLAKAVPIAEAIYNRGAKVALVTLAFNDHEWKKLCEKEKKYYFFKNISLDRPTFKKGFFVVNEKWASQWYHCSPKKLADAAAPSAEKKLATWPQKKIVYQGGKEVIHVKSENVVGFLEGADKKDEALVISAHLDHVGMRSGEGDVIYNGADDDGSGIVSMLQIANAFSLAKKEGHTPRRSILFLAMTAEEEGLLGSDYYTSHPLLPLSKTVVDLNIDMVGRIDKKNKDAADYVYVIGADKLSLDLHKINEEANDTFTHLILDYTYNNIHHPDQLYQRSDHWNFAKNNVPIIFFFDGFHEDYHEVSDEVSKIDFPLLAKRTTLIFHTAWEVANREERIRNNAGDRK